MDATARLDDLERRVAALEREQPVDAPDDEGALWALDGLIARTDEAGTVLLAGAVTLPDGRAARWQDGRALSDLLAVDADRAGDTLGALGSPIRLRLVLRLLEEPRTVQELTRTDGVGTTGQVYHHLRQLTAAGWVRPRGAGRYEVPATRVVPLLGALLVAT